MTANLIYAGVGGATLAAAFAVVGAGVTGAVPETPAFWYFSRASGLVAYFLLWSSVVAGLLLSGRARQVVAPKAAMEFHQTASGTAIAFALFHGLSLTGDRFIGFSLTDILVPLSGSFKPVWVAAGQLSLLFLAAVLASSNLRRRLGNGVWRALHYGAFVSYWLALAHALAVGTDAGRPLVTGFYAFTGLTVLWLTTFRIFVREGEGGR